MSIDDELQNHFDKARELADTVDPDAGLVALGGAATRRRNLSRGAGAFAIVLVALFGTLFFLTRDDDPSDVRIADDPSTTTQAPSTTEAPVDGDVGLGTAIVTVDSDGVVRVNGDVYDVFLEDPVFEPLLDNGRSMITDVGGHDGALLIETPEGVYWTDTNQTQLRLITDELGARILDVARPGLRGGGGMRAAIGWVEDGIETLAVFEIDEVGMLIRSETTSATDLGGEILDASLGGQDNLSLLVTVGADGGCARHFRTDLDGNPTLIDDVLATRSACLPDEMVGLSESNAVLLSAPTPSGSVSVTIIDRADGAANTPDVGADLGPGPIIVDMHTDPAGRNEAVVFRNGEGYIYVDIDSALANPENSGAGVTVVPHIPGAPFTSVRLVPGWEQHSLRAGAPDSPGEGPAQEPLGESVGLLTVDENGVVYINETVDIRWDDNPIYDPIDIDGPGTTIRAIDGSLGWMIIEAESGIWWTDPAGTFLDPVVEGPARLLDVADAPFRAAVSHTGVIDTFDFDVDGREFLHRGRIGPDVFRDERFVVLNGSFDFEAESLLVITQAFAGCNLDWLLSIDGELLATDDARVDAGPSACDGSIGTLAGEVDAVSTTPGQDDNWTLTIGTESVVSPGAFQPRRIQTHTSQVTGKTAAVITGNGPEIVFVDVDAYRSRRVTLSKAIVGLTMPGQPNIISARLVDMLPAHELDGPLEILIDPDPVEPTEPEWPPTDQALNRVVNVASDDVLNVRSGPGVENNIVFTLAPDFEGAVSFGDSVQLEGGSTWTQVFNPRSDDADESGWVNQAFLEPVDGAETRSCLFNGPQDHYIGLDWSSEDVGNPDSDATVVSSMTTYRFGRCIRTVIDLGVQFDFGEGSIPADSLPDDIVVTRGAPTSIDFGGSLIGANFDAAQTSVATNAQQTASVYLRTIRDGSLLGSFYMPSDVVDVHFDNTRARIVIDVFDVGADRPEFGYTEPLWADPGLVITATEVVNDRFTVTGLARPFEGMLDIALRNADGQVTAEFIGTYLDGADNVSETGVGTTGWAEAWGQFEFSMLLDENEVDGLIIDFDASGGNHEGGDPTVSVPLGALTEFAQLP